MNPDQPSREQIETRITALLLGELSADEAALLRYTIAQDPALQKLHDELQATLSLVREAAKHPEEPAVEKAKALKLSGDRRQKLLTHFKTPRTTPAKEPLFWLKRIKIVPRPVETMVIAAVIALLAAMLLPTLSSAKRKAQSRGTYGTVTMADRLFKSVNREPAADGQTQVAASMPPPPVAAPASSTPLALGIESQSASKPATTIVLPQTEATVTAQAETPTGSNDGVYSQNIVGYVNLPPADKVPPMPTAPAPVRAMPPPLPDRSNIAALTEERHVPGVAASEADNPDEERARIEAERQYELQRHQHDHDYEGMYVLRQGDAEISNTSSDHLKSPPNTIDKASAGTLVQDGKTFYEMGKWDEAKAKLDQALKADPGNETASYYSDLIKQDQIKRDIIHHNTDTQERIERVEPQWILPKQPADSVPESARKPLGAFPSGAVAGALPTSSNENSQPLLPPSVNAPLATTVAPTPAAMPHDSPAAPTEYTIVSGDTFSKIARKDGVTLKALEEANPGVNPKKLKLGKKLTIPAPATATTAGLVNGFGGFGGRDGFASAAVGGGVGTTLQQRNLADSFNTGPADNNSALQSRAGDKNHFVSRYAYLPPSTPQFDSPATNGVVANTFAMNTFSPGTATIQTDAVQLQEMIQPGLIDFEGVDLSEVLNVYGKLANRTVLRSQLPNAQIVFNPQTPLTKAEAIQALQAALALNGVSLANVGDKFVKVLPSDQASSAGEEIDRASPANLPVSGSYITQVVRLKHVKPSEMLGAIRPFSGQPNSMLPIDNDGLLVLRDSAENIKHMQEMIAQVDIGPPVEFISEVIPIRFGKVDDIASTLETLEQKQEVHLANQTKIILNEASSSLLIYATREDMEVIKDEIVKLDTNLSDLPIRKPAPNAPVPQPEILTRDNNFSTFSLNVSDVSFKFAEASLQNGKLPDTASIRSEEFINAFDYRDPEAAPGQPMAFTSERARYPFAYNRELLRFAVKAAATGRQQGRALNLVLLLDNSGSMERADRVAIIREALRVLAAQLQPQDTVSVVTFSRTARLWADGVTGDKAAETFDRVGAITPEGGTNLEEAMRLAYETAHRHYLANGMNRVVLLTDGAANLGNVDPEILKQSVEVQRKQGIALDCFGIGWEDYNDNLLELLSSNGDGRYAFLNSPEDAAKDFAAKLAGALQIAAADVKVQVEFNPQRVISYRQIGYATHQLTKEQFRDNTVAAGQIAAQEAGNALYAIETNPGGSGPVATVHVRYRIPGTDEYREHSWSVDYTGNAPALEKSSPAMRLASTASAFSEWLAASPYAQEVTPDALLNYLSGVPEIYGADDRPKQLETMIREAKSLEGTDVRATGPGSF